MYSFISGWQKLREGAKGLSRKVWSWTKILNPYTYAILSQDLSRSAHFLEDFGQKRSGQVLPIPHLHTDSQTLKESATQLLRSRGWRSRNAMQKYMKESLDSKQQYLMRKLVLLQSGKQKVASSETEARLKMNFVYN